MSGSAGRLRSTQALAWIAVMAILLAGCATSPPAPRPQVRPPAPAPATDVDEARRFLQGQPDRYATFREAERYRAAGNREAVFLLVKYAARKGVPEAEYEMGRRYDPATHAKDGIVLKPHAPTAAQWYERAASKGHVPSMVRLGGMYGDGLIRPTGERNATEESLHWLNKAAQAGGE